MTENHEPRARRRLLRDAAAKTAMLGALVTGVGVSRYARNPVVPADGEPPAAAMKETARDDLSPEQAYAQSWLCFDRALGAALQEASDKSSGVSKAALLGGVSIRLNVGSDTLPAECTAHVKLLGTQVKLPAMAQAFDAYAQLCRRRADIADPRALDLPDVPDGQALIAHVVARFQQATGAAASDTRAERAWAKDVFDAAVKARGLHPSRPDFSKPYGFMPLLHSSSTFSHVFTADLYMMTKEVPVTVTVEAPKRFKEASAAAVTAR